jgi:hypothetical protein
MVREPYSLRGWSETKRIVLPIKLARRINEIERNVQNVVTPSVTPLSVSETEIETATLEYETKLEAFDPEKYVRRIQAVWKWPHCDYSPLVENLILKCFEAEVLTHNWPRIEAASYVTERIESIAKILVAFDDDQQKFIPSLYKLMDTKAYRSPDKDWERKGARKRSAAAVPAGRPKW